MSIKSLLVGCMVSIISLIPFAHGADPETVVDVAISSEVHSTLVTAVVAADLAGTLSSEGPFTVFAPVNSAFEKLPAGTVEMLLEPENIEVLQSILTYHVIPGKVMAENLSQGLTAQTVEGSEVVFTHMNNAWYINSANIVATDIVAGNGVVHVIDSVIMPPMSQKEILSALYELRGNMDEMMEDRVDSVLMKYENMVSNLSESQEMLLQNKLMVSIDMYLNMYAENTSIVNMLSLLKYEILGKTVAGSVVDIAISSEVHSTLVTAVVEANLAEVLSSDGPFTVFAPVNDAFAALPDGTLEMLLAEESKASLSNILTYHVVPGAYFASDIYDGLMLETLNGGSLEFTIEGGEVYINGLPTLLATDITSSNGIVHVITDVLIPSE